MSSTICIIIPCYNEASRLPSDTFLQYQQRHPNVRFCFVNDGSKDQTLAVLKHLAQRNPAQNEVLHLEQNQGKAGAVRAGMLHMQESSAVDYIGYFDADLATPLEAINDLEAYLDSNPGRQMVMGSRIQHLGTHIQRNTQRHYIGRVIATGISLILQLPVYDTQCGAKLFRRAIVPVAFKSPFISPWLFDVEILARLIQHFGRTNLGDFVAEMPLREWIEQSDSRVKLSYMFQMPVELYKIYRTYRT
ncbi:dolichyl-phosphate beta-glucosyltransferase [Larkinella terrae]|uniref:dolichyl-phosphate beta-glucosyltransferase n=1 Tax=Larkinella terrae TaxID=2025311 RepID=A0A7K0EEJ4_9BACT|nr:dolichyl-phosphate beta-glucosyltransferase [Larkinella terrae]MRS60165.1 glycosyltransferase [Larkinella terrae]